MENCKGIHMDFKLVLSEFGKMIEEGRRIQAEREQELQWAAFQAHVKDLFKEHSTDDLKALWHKNEANHYALDEVDGFCIYEIMAALEQRGEGDLCRI